MARKNQGGGASSAGEYVVGNPRGHPAGVPLIRLDIAIDDDERAYFAGDPIAQGRISDEAWALFLAEREVVPAAEFVPFVAEEDRAPAEAPQDLENAGEGAEGG